MNPKDRPTRRPSPPEDRLVQLQMKIAQRADLIWRNAGCLPGTDLDNWLRAEREILAEVALAS